jgi:hypothetical protein
MDGTQVLTIMGVSVVLFLTVIGLMIKLHVHTDQTIQAIQAEMRDFHGRLERQDAEFKSRLLYENKRG